MNRIALAWLPLIAAVLLLAACGASHHSIFRHQKLDQSRSAIITVDAKQRAILIGNEQTSTTGDGETRKIQKFCSEPSPDVFSVVAQALSAGGTFGKSADPKSVELALNTAFSSAEQGSTIPRTQTINMLRELMFRTCERYLNGGIGNLELPIQAARDQRLMVSILAIESLTGAVTPKPVVIGANANASGGASGAEAAVRLDDAHKALQARTAAQQSRQNEYNEITTDKKHCEQIAEAVAKKEDDKLPQELKDKRAKCETATSALAAAKKDTASNASHYATLKDTAASGGIPVATTLALMVPKADGGIDRAHGDAVKEVAAVVKEIVGWNMDQDEFLFFCLKIIGSDIDSKTRESANANDSVKTCFEYINSTLRLEERKNDAAAARLVSQIAQSRQNEISEIQKQFEKFWALISPQGKSGSFAPDKIASLRTKAASRAISWPSCFDNASTKPALETCFHNIELAQDRRDLLRLGE